jgi:hypothetical protein
VERGGPCLAVRRFRRSFNLGSVPDEFLLRVSADSRYRLFLNGRRVGRGPLKGRPERYRFETYDVADRLVEGRNVLAAEVFWFGLNAPNSEVHSGFAGFLLQGPEGAGIDTPGDWLVEVDRAVSPDTTRYIANAQNFLNHTEKVDGQAYPAGWWEPGFDDSEWQPAVAVCEADINRSWGETHPVWELFPRPLPMLVEEPRRFARTIQDHREVDHLFGEEPVGWTVPAGEAAEIVLDAGALTTGFPVLEFKGGRRRRVEVVYSECLYQRSEDDAEVSYVKEVRDDLSGEVHGYRDTVTLPGGEFTYEPFHWRTFWFVAVRVSAGEEPMELTDFSYRFTTYPQELRAEYDSSDADAGRMLKTSWRTLQLCSHETYEDCPYYEQHNYLFDSHNEALCSYALAGETELPKHTIRLFRDSMRPDGLVHARVPSRRRLRLPYFALSLIQMLRNHWWWVGASDEEFVRESLFAVEGTLWWFRSHLREDGLLGPLPYWSPSESGLTWQTCEYAFGLRTAIELYEQVGHPRDADRWRPWLKQVRTALRELCWDDNIGLFRHAPDSGPERTDQLSQVYAILAGVPTAEQRERMLGQLLDFDYARRIGRPRRYFLARVMEEHGLYDRFDSLILDDYRAQLDRHLTTWVEGAEPGRSDCHAWSSWIGVDFLTAVLGIKPAKPGFEEVLIRPQFIYEHARGAMPTPRGRLEVEWQRGDAEVELCARVPDGTPATVALPGAAPQRFENGGEIAVTAELPEGTG